MPVLLQHKHGLVAGDNRPGIARNRTFCTKKTSRSFVKYAEITLEN
jgi:hypothetical protein